MIKKKDTLGQILQQYPEVAPVLSKAGLHCVGCHVSEYESVEDGCKAHGLSDEKIENIIKEANAKITEFDAMEDVSFTKKATLELEKRKGKEKYVKIMPVFDGFDFEATSEKEEDEIILNKELSLIGDKKIQRFLKGVVVDFSEKESDFTAKRT
ncbi:MAG: DUF1858 domain-containing protein [Candidatus Diapherotrites archaeon]|jgi:hybrid cluster-associated redox disulfide protein|uniref:DUF1858 domain-containing protein n=1 Tax=Candidatus Iainarchaeum sp. TaxID=3101447 RepID=A0A8T5GFV7_9ARCH|nr:DUF1858 domain-containing protein [Candidatus Diapherotrites archaeon]